MDFDALSRVAGRVCVSAFGGPALYFAQNAEPVGIHAVFDRKSVSIDPKTGVEIQSYQPKVGVMLADLPANPRKGDQVEVKSVRYRVIEVVEDGRGGAELHLQKA